MWTFLKLEKHLFFFFFGYTWSLQRLYQKISAESQQFEEVGDELYLERKA